MALASDAIKSARVYLNDTNAITWTDALLLPMLQEAHGELVQALHLNGSQVFKMQTNPITVPAGTKTLPSQPTNIIDPIMMLEGDVGDDPDDFEDMIQCTFLPYYDQDTWLTYWSFTQNVISFIGATQDRAVVLRYTGTVPTPQYLTDQLGIIFAERFLGPRIAAIATATIGRENKTLTAMAEHNLYTIIQNEVTKDQRPARRREYRRRKCSGSPGPTSVISH